jgi:translation initiation factor 2 beta subunit (eIF-2beta)/eIF-5
MALVRVCLAVLMISWCFTAQASPTHSSSKRHAKHSSDAEDENLGNGKQIQTHPQKYDSDEANSTLSEVKEPDSTIIPLEDVATSLDLNTFVHLSNVQLSIPVDIDLGNINPDFSRMILNVDSAMGSMEIEGDYTLLVKNIATLPFFSQGHFYANLNNVTITGRTTLALTPAALLALDSDFVYKPQEVTARVVPMTEITSPEEANLSKDIVAGTLAELINKEIQDHLNYYVDAQINLALSKISVFTVGHKNIKSVTKEQLTQSVQIGDLFDELLADVKTGIRVNQTDEIDIPSFHRNFSEKLESNLVNGTFSAEQGWLSGLSTFKRSSNVSLSKSGEEFILSAMLEFDDLQMGYDRYVAMFLKSNVTGELDGNFMHRQLTIKVAMDPKEDGTCTSTLNELRIFKVNGYRIQKITNIGSFDWLHIRINNWLIGYFQTKIVKDVEKIMSTAVRNSLSRFDCGEYLPSLKILV